MPSTPIIGTKREIALAGKPSNHGGHRAGLPESLRRGVASRPLPDAYFVVVVESAGQLFLVRAADDGSFAGDTWHESLEEAKEKAAREYPALSRWIPVPDDVADLLEFAREQFRAE